MSEETQIKSHLQCHLCGAPATHAWDDGRLCERHYREAFAEYLKHRELEEKWETAHRAAVRAEKAYYRAKDAGKDPKAIERAKARYDTLKAKDDELAHQLFPPQPLSFYEQNIDTL